ncbi:hypothetical protein [Shinella sumterensis]|uniref:Uncharacterized protein n=1 Tax=Shinella sumterensis TaxID=1967501 RepID=A0AA50CMK8_9HYPH|nr:hypothetical protein [Shinella sumterensis]MCD1263661.1 hypothetical protein [Shinella sumterensis]TFE97995.1 hypothetical protein B5M44_11990 [Shinella sumterensis]WLR98260.1 hypothetical protein Q9313_04310 [Shinella sumterensis]
MVIDYPRIAGAGLLSVKPPADVALVSCGAPPFGPRVHCHGRNLIAKALAIGDRAEKPDVILSTRLYTTIPAAHANAYHYI